MTPKVLGIRLPAPARTRLFLCDQENGPFGPVVDPIHLRLRFSHDPETNEIISDHRTAKIKEQERRNRKRVPKCSFH
jgi:hypothetical protein